MASFSRKTLFLSAFLVASFLSFFAASLAHAATIAPGDLIKGPSSDSVYYYGQNGKRFVFPNAKTYFTWYPDFSTVKTITADELAAIPLGGNVTYRPGVKLVKVATDPKVYAVAAHGVLRWVKTEDAARSLYGSQWNKSVDDIPDTFFVNYTVGADVTTSADFTPSSEMLDAKDIDTDKKFLAQSTYFTSYGYNDNDDGSGNYGTAVIAYPSSRHPIATEGLGTYADPITFATDPREIPSQTIIYVPYLQKYFIMEDECVECTADWNNGKKWRVDLFMGGNTSMQPAAALAECESSVTRNDIMYVNAGPGYPVDTTPLFSGGVCTARVH